MDARACQRSSVLCLGLSNRLIGSSTRPLAMSYLHSMLTLVPSALMAEVAGLHIHLVLVTPAPRGMSLAANLMMIS